jgi:CspA family cold shock protein
MQTGKIARLMDKGFGFIAREGEEKDLFFHASALIDVDFNSLQEGDMVTFKVEEGPKGVNAVEVSLAPQGAPVAAEAVAEVTEEAPATEE